MSLQKVVSLSTVAVATLLVCLGTSCGKQMGISGEISGAEGQTVYLESFTTRGATVLDSATLDSKGRFHFHPAKALSMDLYRIKLSESQGMLVMTDSTESLVVKGLADSLAAPTMVTGSAQSELLHEFKSKVDGFNIELNDLKTSLDGQASISSEEKLEINKKATQLQEERREYIKSFLDSHKEDPVSLAAVTSLNIYSDLSDYVKVRDRVKDKYADTYYYQVVSQQITQAKNQKAKRQGSNQAQQAKNNKYSAGMEAPDIVMADLAGQTRKLSDLRGKVVLIDFWASWCGPCRRENPNVVRAYEEYREDGFEVFSVSLDRQKDRWEKAVEADNLIWPNHVCDMKGWQNEASSLYGISSIPHTILVGRDGKIIATKLRGAALDAKLEELFKG